MMRINLLPWRAERRRRRERRFFLQMAVAVVLSLIVVGAWSAGEALRIDQQRRRNAYLQARIERLDGQIARYGRVRAHWRQWRGHLRTVMQLQSSRSQMLHLFDMLAQTIPDGVRLTALAQKGRALSLHGTASSNAGVAQYMRRLQHSPWTTGVALQRIEVRHRGAQAAYAFDMSVALTWARPRPAHAASAAAPLP